jgi:hypothetical protein
LSKQSDVLTFRWDLSSLAQKAASGPATGILADKTITREENNKQIRAYALNLEMTRKNRDRWKAVAFHLEPKRWNATAFYLAATHFAGNRAGNWGLASDFILNQLTRIENKRRTGYQAWGKVD